MTPRCFAVQSPRAQGEEAAILLYFALSIVAIVSSPYRGQTRPLLAAILHRSRSHERAQPPGAALDDLMGGGTHSRLRALSTTTMATAQPWQGCSHCLTPIEGRKRAPCASPWRGTRGTLGDRVGEGFAHSVHRSHMRDRAPLCFSPMFHHRYEVWSPSACA
jgi:hypothetical protein